VLAEEAVRAAGSKKQILLIAPDANWGPASTVEKAFRTELKRDGASVVTSQVNVGDPMRSGEVGLKPADLSQALEKSPDSGAVVSLAGAPLHIGKLNATTPPLLIVATVSLGNAQGVPSDHYELGKLLDAKIIRLAIIDGGDAAASAPTNTDATHQLFAQHYRILRAPD
jgi:hypothetical protein